MFKQILSAVLLFTFTIVQANAGSHNGLKDAFNDLNYSLTVEWDQNDDAFLGQTMADFLAKIDTLRAEGLTNEDMINFAANEIKDERVASDLKAAFAVVSANNMSQTEATDYLVSAMKKSYNQGASWSGASPVAIFMVVVLVSIIGAIAYTGVIIANNDEESFAKILGAMGFKRPDVLAQGLLGMLHGMPEDDGEEEPEYEY